MNNLKASAFKALTSIFKHTVGRGLGKIPYIRAVYDYLYRSLAVNELTLNVRGSKMITRVSNGDGISYQLLFYRNGLEKYETKLFEKLVVKDMKIVDVGANTGYYTLMAAKLVGDKGEVFAFEPEPENYALLVRNIELNNYKNVIPVKKAVFSKTGKADLFLNRETGAHGFLPDREGVIGMTTVETISLDEYFKGRESPIDIIKIDVEGAELAVLQGMQNIIRNNANLKIFTELFWPSSITKSGSPTREYWDKLVESGFKFIYLIDEHEQRLEPADFSSMMRYYENELTEKPLSPNLLCAKVPLKVSSH